MKTERVQADHPKVGKRRWTGEYSDMGSIRGKVAVIQTRDALMQTAASHFISAAAEAIAACGRFTVALSGGSTPQSMYALLATDPYASRVDWSRVDVFWGDERCVPPGNPVNNYRMAREALLDHVPLPKENIHRIRGEDDPVEGAAAYERILREMFHTPIGQPQPAPGARFDLILLGMGEDGHTASLFPRSAAVRETSRWVMAEHIAAVPMSRVTLTPVVINAAAEIVFLVSGREKASTLHRVLEGPYQPDTLPAQVIAPSAGRLRWLADADAAADLAEAGGR